MRSLSSLKQGFLKKWAMGLQVCSSSRKDMSILERMKAIKLSADVALASARNPSTCWSRALIVNASKEDENKVLVHYILGDDSEKMKKKDSMVKLPHEKKVPRSKKILKKSCCTIRRVKKIAPPMALACSVAKRLVKKRTQVLKRLVPGGEFMDEFSLMEETLDYIVSLRAQVDVMRKLTRATGHLGHK
ncbi:hypothetical protein U1Q18_027923 [Sarracenia purpurea var. burkii]